MRTIPMAAVLLLAVTGCVSRAQSSRTVAVRSDGSQREVMRAAIDGAPGDVGPQEIIGFYFPFGPLALKGGVVWDGQPIILGPPAMATPYLATDCAPAPRMVEVEESYTEMVPTTRTRKVMKAVVDPPRAAPAKAPGCEPVSFAGECVGGVCSVK